MNIQVDNQYIADCLFSYLGVEDTHTFRIYGKTTHKNLLYKYTVYDRLKNKIKRKDLI